jgi:hypothetical protein
MIWRDVRAVAAVQALGLTTLFTFGVVTINPSILLAQMPGMWTNTGSLNAARQGHTATLLPNGNVRVVGGEDTSGNILEAESGRNETSSLK